MDKVNIPEEIRYLQQEIMFRKDMIAFQNRKIEKAKKSFFETCYPHIKEGKEYLFRPKNEEYPTTVVKYLGEWKIDSALGKLVDKPIISVLIQTKNKSGKQSHHRKWVLIDFLYEC